MTLVPYGKDVTSGLFRPFKAGDSLCREDGTPVTTTVDRSVSAIDFDYVSASTAPTLSTVGPFDVAIFSASTLNQIHIRWLVPADKDIGDVQLKTRISMDAGSAGVIKLDISVAVNGAALGAPTTVLLDPNDSPNVVELLNVLAISGLSPNDDIVVQIDRDGADGSDTHGGGMRLFDAVFSYPGAGGLTGPTGPAGPPGAGLPATLNFGSTLFLPTDETVPATVTLADEYDAAIMTKAFDTEIKVQEVVPLGIGGLATILPKLRFSMSSAAAATVEFAVEFTTNGAPIGPPTSVVIAPSAAPGTVNFLPLTTLTGPFTGSDDFLFKLARRTGFPGDTHPGDVELRSIVFEYPTV